MGKRTAGKPRTMPVLGSPARTRADQPFKVHVTMSELLDDPSLAEATRMVNFYHHVQSYGTKGDGVNIDRTQATLEGSLVINQNGIHTYSYTVNQVPGANRAKVRGEERFSVFSLPDYGVEHGAQLASQFIQVWPVSDGSISGIQNGQLIEFKVPDITISLNARPPQQFIDPEANLLEANRGLRRAEWILPLTTPLERPSVFEMFR